MKRIVLGLLAATAMSVSAFAADDKRAVIYDLGGKFDKSFNEAAFNGAEKYAANSGVKYREFEIQNEAQREQALRKFASDGNSPIVIAGFSAAAAIEKVAAEFPDTKFIIIDAEVDKPNVRSVVFNDNEGSYLVGVIAAKSFKTGTVSFIGGMDVPLIRNLVQRLCRRRQGHQPGRQGYPEHDRRYACGHGTIQPRAAKSQSRRSTRVRT